MVILVMVMLVVMEMVIMVLVEEDWEEVGYSSYSY